MHYFCKLFPCTLFWVLFPQDASYASARRGLYPLHLPKTRSQVSADLKKGQTEIEWKLVKAAQRQGEEHFVLFSRPPRIKNKTNFTTAGLLFRKNNGLQTNTISQLVVSMCREAWFAHQSTITRDRKLSKKTHYRNKPSISTVHRILTLTKTISLTQSSVLSKLRLAGRCFANGDKAQLSKKSLDKLSSMVAWSVQPGSVVIHFVKTLVYLTAT